MGSEHRIHTVMWLLMRRKMINFCFDTNQLDVKSGRKGKKKGKGKKKKQQEATVWRTDTASDSG